MSETKWTPGPWSASKWLDTVEDVEGFSLTANDYLLPLNSCEGTIEEAEANARLISAAPDLYEALQAMVGDCKFSNIEGVEHWHVKQMPTDAALDAARAALAKARGE